jgi:hypothetical protein
MSSPNSDVEDLRASGDPRLSEADKEDIRDLTRGPDLALELAAVHRLRPRACRLT